ncbi:MAG: VPLPA-CTERM-specific exosortase XrtD [Desulfosarcinaceae bacterium]|nr:VPLPA-CTERM-specific exosortase XrtD [Desulfosarcinaceae bacterium]
MRKLSTTSPVSLIAPIVILLSVIALAYWDTIGGLYRQWTSNEDYSHGLLVGPIAIYLLWERRRSISDTVFQTDWRGLMLMVIALMLHVVGELGAELFTVRFSMLLCLVGGVWVIYGGRLVRTAWFPLAFLFMMLPLPGFIYRNLTFSLQLLSTTLSVKLLHLTGISAYQEGNIIDIGITQFQVVDACNGLRYILPLMTLGILMASFGQRPIWKRLVLVAMTIPVAILANVLRIFATGLLASLWGLNIAEGFFHSFSGFIVFLFSLSVLLIIMRLLMGRGAISASGAERVDPSRHPLKSLSPIAIGGAVVTILLAPVAADVLGKTPAMQLQKPLTDFPLEVGEWQGRFLEMEPEIWARVGGQSYAIIDYQNDGKMPINFYTAYYEYQRKAGDFIHSPKLCLPGAGWYVEEATVRTLSQEDAIGEETGLILNDMVIQKNGQRQLVYYWYQGRDRNFTSEYAAKFYMVWDGVFRRRTDGALVRLVMPVISKDAVTAARQTLDRFALFASGKLNEFLP